MKVVTFILSSLVSLLASLPASSSYKLNNYGFGAGGTGGSSSATYSVNGIVGEQSTLQVSQSPHAAQSGNNYTQNVNVPIVTLANISNFYNKLLLTIDTQNNPSDTLFAVAISSDNFVTTNYVKSDNTIGSTLVYPTDYRTFAGWGSGSGINVIGLQQNLTYYAKAKAIQGKYSESAYGPVSTASTATAQLSFSLSPATVALGTLNAGSVATASPSGSITFATNGESGGNVYIASKNGGLKTSVTATQINSATADLSSGAVTQGYGAQGSAPTQTSGGPLTTSSPFNGATNNVGGIQTGFLPIFISLTPIVGGSASIVIKAKSSSITPAATDYTDILTLVVAGAF